MKKITFALVGIAMSTSAFAEGRFNVTCREDVLGKKNSIAATYGIFQATMSDGKAIIPSAVKPGYSYVLTTYRGCSAKATKTATIFSGGAISSYASNSQGQSQGQAQGQAQDQGQCTDQGQSCTTQDQAQDQCMEQGKGSCTSQDQAQGQCTEQEKGSCTSQDQAQGQCMEQGQTAEQGAACEQDQSQGKTIGKGTCGTIVAPALISAPYKIKLENKVKFGDVKHTKKAALASGGSANLSFHYHPGIMKFVKGVNVSCQVTNLGE